ncbi:MAG: hypothetical protein GYB65_20475 [Chloroflexi bacterium]|nr:hypothetical protein [Chloroflexota bacterium]
MSISQHTVFSPDAETIGQVHLSLLESINLDNYKDVLARHGMDEIDPERWYPMQSVVDLMDEIGNRQGGMTDLVSIGIKLMETALLPPELEELPLTHVLQGWNNIYLANNRGTDPGDFQIEFVDDQHAIMHCRIPWPDDYTYGVFYGAARRWLPDSTDFTVYYEEDGPRRDFGDETTVIHIDWN